MAQVLEGIRVLDISQVAAAPMTARHLADFGADVIHVEHPERGDSWRVYQEAVTKGRGGPASEINYNWENYNRNKRSLSIDLTQQGGQTIIQRMAKDADVLVTNLRPYELQRFDLEYGTLSQLNPRLVFAWLTGLGKEGADKDAPAYDSTSYWTRAGIPYMLSRPGMFCAGYRPAFGDNVAALALAYGIMMALYARERTGLGQLVDISLFHVGLYQLSYDVAGALVTRQDYDDWVLKPPQELLDEAEAVNRHLLDFYMANAGSALTVPLPYETRDGRRILLAMVQSDLYWSKFCSAIEREELEKDPRFETTEMRNENSGMLYHILKDIFLSRTLEEWKTRLEGIPYGCYQNLRDIVSDPIAHDNGYFVDYEHPSHGRIEGLANPVRLSDMPAVVTRAAPEFGQHTEEVLLENGYTWEDITQFKEQGIIA